MLAETFSRSLHLLALSCAPAWLSPDPAPSSAAQGWVSGVALGALLVGALRLRRGIPTRGGAAAAAAIFVAVAGALVGGLVAHGDDGPLGAAVPFVGPLWWGALAVAAGAVGGAWRPGAKVGPAGAAIVVVVGVLALGSGWELCRDPAAMWARAATLEPAHAEAVVRSVDPERPAAAGAAAQACLAEAPARCPCRGLDVWAAVRRGADASTRSEVALGVCERSPLVIATRAHVLALGGAHEDALQLARTGWSLPADATASLVELELLEAQAIAYEGMQQRRAALFAAERAVDLGGGRRARLLAASVAIGAGAYDRAKPHLEALLGEDPADADALYNRALIADRQGNYNLAREGYLAALRAAPRYAAARLNLALLTWRRGVVAEANHHAELFVRDFPDDPRGADLRARVARPPPRGAGP